VIKEDKTVEAKQALTYCDTVLNMVIHNLVRKIHKIKNEGKKKRYLFSLNRSEKLCITVRVPLLI